MINQKNCEICNCEKAILVVNEYLCKSCIKDIANIYRDYSHKNMKDVDIVIEIIIDLDWIY